MRAKQRKAVAATMCFGYVSGRRDSDKSTDVKRYIIDFLNEFQIDDNEISPQWLESEFFRAQTRLYGKSSYNPKTTDIA